MNQISRSELARFLDSILDLAAWPDDPSNNGLQFAGGDAVTRAVFAVDASAELFRIAAERGAQFIFVHHGISWGSGIRRIDGILAERVTLLARNGISLYAAHLPLDAHMMMFAMAIEDEFGISFDEPVNFVTVQDVVNFIEANQK